MQVVGARPWDFLAGRGQRKIQQLEAGTCPRVCEGQYQKKSPAKQIQCYQPMPCGLGGSALGTLVRMDICFSACWLTIFCQWYLPFPLEYTTLLPSARGIGLCWLPSFFQEWHETQAWTSKVSWMVLEWAWDNKSLTWGFSWNSL